VKKISWRGRLDGHQMQKVGIGICSCYVSWSELRFRLGREDWIECSDKGGEGVASPSCSQSYHTWLATSKLCTHSWLVLPHRGKTFNRLSTCFWRWRARLYIVESRHCRHSLGVSDIDGWGLLNVGGWSWICRDWSEVKIGFLDFLVLADLV
jgi:hypothetical protein